ncbi:MAG: insulinase family protein [Deltaproteobacteria bacterium]|nr:insulinase family protein [Deltaproteobacteria bacterium]
MSASTSLRLFTALVLALCMSACGGSSGTDTTGSTASTGGEAVAAPAETVEETPPAPRQPPPASAAPRDVHLPPPTRISLRNGLELNTVAADRLPVVYVRLVIKSGLARDPENLPGLAGFLSDMLEQGTTTRDSAEIADAVEHIGASLDVVAEADSMALQIRGTADQLDAMLAILADIAMHPAFADEEIGRLRTREQDRLQIAYSDPSMLARREFFRLAYGAHPYAHVDLSTDSLARITRADLVAWHRTHFVPSNAFVVVVGAVTPEASRRAVERAFRSWRGAAVPAQTFPEIPARTGREILLVHRPGSVQSLIAIGNLTIPRAHPDFIALDVANQILGGSAASRLFMDLRERRSLTYGAYSGVDEMRGVSPFRARAAVPNQRTTLAMDAFMEHLQRIVHEEAPAQEVLDAERYLSDSFPLQIDTYGRIAWMVAYLRLFDLPDDYWDTYRSQIRAVTPAEALRAAQAHIRPDSGIVVVVGDANVVAEPLARWGTVTLVSTDGEPLTMDAVRAQAQPAQQ